MIFRVYIIRQSELKSFSDNEMISDVAIDVAQKMMEKQPPRLKGLQDPILGQTMSFRHFQSQPFGQILHDGVAHWVVISTLNCKSGEIMLMNSLFKGRVSVHIKKQICFITNSKEREIKIKVAGVQQQTNGIDCGLYAIAFINYMLHNKEYPFGVKFDQSKMRHHLLRSISCNSLQSFPVREVVQKKEIIKKIFKLKLYCTCRMYWVPSDESMSAR